MIKERFTDLTCPISECRIPKLGVPDSRVISVGDGSVLKISAGRMLKEQKEDEEGINGE